MWRNPGREGLIRADPTVTPLPPRDACVCACVWCVNGILSGYDGISLSPTFSHSFSLGGNLCCFFFFPSFLCVCVRHVTCCRFFFFFVNVVLPCCFVCCSPTLLLHTHSLLLPHILCRTYQLFAPFFVLLFLSFGRGFCSSFIMHTFISHSFPISPDVLRVCVPFGLSYVMFFFP